MAVQVYKSVTLEPVECCNCGVIFGMPKSLDDERQRDHKWFYCPNGHGQSYVGETDAEKYKRLLSAEKTRAKALEDQLKASEDAHARGKKRAGAGVCPCCTRQFQNVKLHMSKKHPEYVKESGTKVEQHPAEVTA